MPPDQLQDTSMHENQRNEAKRLWSQATDSQVRKALGNIDRYDESVRSIIKTEAEVRRETGQRDPEPRAADLPLEKGFRFPIDQEWRGRGSEDHREMWTHRISWPEKCACCLDTDWEPQAEPVEYREVGLTTETWTWLITYPLCRRCAAHSNAERSDDLQLWLGIPFLVIGLVVTMVALLDHEGRVAQGVLLLVCLPAGLLTLWGWLQRRHAARLRTRHCCPARLRPVTLYVSGDGTTGLWLRVRLGSPQFAAEFLALNPSAKPWRVSE